MLPQIVRRNAVEHRAARSRQHSWEQLYDERRLEVDETAIGEQARHHVGVLRRRLGSERGERPGWQTEVEPDRKNMPCPHTRADANHLRMLVLIGDDLVEQGQHGFTPAIHDRQAADLDDVELRQDGTDGRLSARNYLFVDEGFAHQPRNHVLRGLACAHTTSPRRISAL